MLAERRQLQRDLRRLAAAQAGYLTAAQAVRIGYSYQAQKYHVDHGNWQRVERALFRIADWPTGSDDHLVRWTLWVGHGAVVSHESALEVHGLGDVNPSRLHLTMPVRSRRHDPALMLHEAVISTPDIEQRNGFRVTSPARALAECAAATLGQEILDGAVHEALDGGLLTPRTLRDTAARLGARAELGIERALAAGDGAR